MLRKGTKSRPNVKVPKHYDNDYESFNIKRPSPSSTLNLRSSSSLNNSSRASGTSASTSTKQDVVVKQEAPDIDDCEMEYDPLALPTASLPAGSDNNTESKDKQTLSTLQSQDDKDEKVFHKLKIIKIHSDSLLKTKHMTVVDPLKLESKDDDSSDKNT